MTSTFNILSMKYLFILIGLVPIFAFSQTSVPNTNTFSLQDVYNAVHTHTSGTQQNLQSCFDNAISGYFNATYNNNSYAPANSMLRFRDYKPTGCVAPMVTTASISNISNSTATGGGNVTSDGGCTVTARGICWNTSTNPTISNSHTTDGSGTGSFTSSLTGLTCGVTYYVRAYATNSQGTSYGDNVSFTTTSQNDPTYAIYNDINKDVSCGSISYTDFTSSLSSAQSACSIFNSCGCTPISCLRGILPRIDQIAVGHTFYTSSDPCIVFNVTGYWLDYNGGSERILYILNGVIQSIASCP